MRSYIFGKVCRSRDSSSNRPNGRHSRLSATSHANRENCQKWVAELKSAVQEECQEYHARLLPALLGDQENDNLDDTGIGLVTVICESEPSLADVKKVACMANASKHNGMDDARRNKYKMLERLQEKGVPTNRQKLCRTESEAVTFFKEQQQRQTAKTQNE